MLRSLGRILRQAAREWLDDNAPRIGAALAFYTIFAIAPLLVICTAIVGFVFGQEAAAGLIRRQASDLVGADAAGVLQSMIASAAEPQVGYWATIASVGMMFFAAIGLFSELQAALNTIWNIRLRADAGWWQFLRARLLSMAMVFFTALLLLAMLIASTAFAAMSAELSDDAAQWIGPSVNSIVTFAVMTLLFAMVYRILPDAKVAWSDVWLGSLTTALLFTAGNYAIGFYLGQSTIKSAYGAAGSLAVLLIWVYYAAQVFLAGAEITQVYARWYGSGVQPRSHAELIDPVKTPALKGS